MAGIRDVDTKRKLLALSYGSAHGLNQPCPEIGKQYHNCSDNNHFPHCALKKQKQTRWITSALMVVAVVVALGGCGQKRGTYYNKKARPLATPRVFPLNALWSATCELIDVIVPLPLFHLSSATMVVKFIPLRRQLHAAKNKPWLVALMCYTRWGFSEKDVTSFTFDLVGGGR